MIAAAFYPSKRVEKTQIHPRAVVSNSAIIGEGTRIDAGAVIGENVISNTDTFTQYEGVSVTKAPSYQDLDVLLEQGRVDAACMDSCIAQTYMDDDRMFLDTVIAEQEYGVATQKGSDLSGEVKSAIREMLDDGTIDSLITKWNWEK